jgi:hypothetical protein
MLPEVKSGSLYSVNKVDTTLGSLELLKKPFFKLMRGQIPNG